MHVRFNPLDHPVCFLKPDHLPPVESWTQHIPFACAVVELSKPAVLVELGTHCGTSYCAFCQAVAHLRLPTRCTAVDTWQGDAHAGYYGEEILNALKAHHDPRYAGFSRLFRTTFDEALKDFADGSIDLLHIDGLHTYEAVRHDFEVWLPKMSPRGVVLFHDTQVHENSFGVWRLWRELQNRYPSFEFEHGYGLGVIATGAEPPAGLQPFFNGSPEEQAGLRDFFQRSGHFHLSGPDKATITSLQHDCRRRDEEIAGMKNSLSWRLTAPLRLITLSSSS
jgi:O-antigen biosynthesis protein